MSANYTGSEIAIIGMSGRFPMARDVNEFWKNLSEGRECIRFLDEKEKAVLPAALRDHPDFVPCLGGVLEDKDLFDAEFFHYTPVEAELMDPQIRLFHESAWHALEDAGIRPQHHPGLIGLYAAASSGLLWQAKAMMSQEKDKLGYFAASSLFDKDILSTRISYKLNLKGPSLMVHTTCSGSLVAIHLACQAILNGECDVALAGGVKVNVKENNGYIHEKGMILSPDGHCRAFDENAGGTIGGEGVGVVVLKALEDALRDRDHIHAVIRGTAINNDGDMKLGYTAPSIEGQANVLRMALQSAGVSPESVTYIETHGTGTEIGDPIEVEALKQAYGSGLKNHCAIGSVKTNIGHLDSASGVAGLIKTTLALKHGKIPASLNFTSPNKKMDIDNSPFFVNTTLRPWKRDATLRRAAVSSFGIGGTNAHVILEEWPDIKGQGHQREGNLLLLSAGTSESLQKTVSQYGQFLKQSSAAWDDVCFTSQTARRHFPFRLALSCKHKDEAIAKLEACSGRAFGRVKEGPDAVVFMFSGQGSQYAGMGLALYHQYPVFKRWVDKGIHHLEKILGHEVWSTWKGEGDARKINQTAFAQPLLYIIEYAMAQLLMSLGIRPKLMIGHSLGEYTAAAIAGVFSFEDGLKIVSLRGKLMQQMEPGAMISVPLGESEAMTFTSYRVNLAAVNTSSSCVLSGDAHSIEDCISKLAAIGVDAIRLHTSHAFHSYMMERVLPEFEQAMEKIRLQAPQIPFVSNVTGRLIRSEEAVDAKYWSGHIRAAVRFANGMETVLASGGAACIEIGPGKTLYSFAKSAAKDRPDVSLFATLRHPKDDISDTGFLSAALGEMWSGGIAIDWQAMYAGMPAKKVSLPGYAFDRKKYWLSDQLLKKSLSGQAEKDGRLPFDSWFYVPVWKQLPIAVKPSPEAKQGTCVIFDDFIGFSESLASRLKEKFSRIIRVRPAATFSQQDTNTYTLRPGEACDYDALIRAMLASGQKPDQVIDCWGLSNVRSSSADSLKHGFYHHLPLIQSVLRHGITDAARITVITNETYAVIGTEQPDPAKAAIAGLMKVAPQEISSIRYQHIDIDDSAGQPGTLKKISDDILGDHAGSSLAYRHGYRWQLQYEPYQVPATDLPAFKNKGTYVITGGLGTLGLYLAEYLVSRYEATVVLLHHGSFPKPEAWDAITASAQSDKKLASRIALLRRISALNGTVVVRDNVEVTDLSSMQEALRGLEVNGVFHFAAVTDNKVIVKPLEMLRVGDCEKIFAPKFAGIQVLADALKTKQPDFCVVSSSLSSVLGGLGFTAYASANALADSSIRLLQKEGAFPWIGINFDGWKIVDHPGKEKPCIINGEGIEVLERIIASGICGQVVISVRDLGKRISEWVLQREGSKKQEAVAEARHAHPRPDIATTYVKPSSETETALEEILKQAFGYDRIGVDDDFFGLGGDSLLAINVIANIHKRFDVRIPIRDFYADPTIRGLVKQVTGVGAVSVHKRIKPAEVKQHYALSSIQERLYVASQLHREETHYNTPFVFLLEGPATAAAVGQILNVLVARHESLRTSFPLVKGVPRQRVHRKVALTLENNLISQGDLARDAEQALRKMAKDFVRPFDLAVPPLLRAAFISLQEDRHVLLLDIHHIITDAVSNKVLIGEMQELLNEKALKTQAVQYKDFCEWHRIHLGKHELVKQEAFWLERLSGDLPYTLLPADGPRSERNQFDAERVRISFEGATCSKIRELISAEESTTYVFFLTVINILLSRYVNRSVMLVGTETGGRPHADLDTVVGMFVGLLPLKNEIGPEDTFKTFLKKVKTSTLQAFENQDYQFSELVNRLRIQAAPNTPPLFNIIVSMDSISMGGNHRANDRAIRIRLMDFQGDKTIWDVRFGIYETEDNFHINLTYASALFQRATIDLMAERIRDLIRQILSEPSTPVRDLKIKPMASKTTRLSEQKTPDFNF